MLNLSHYCYLTARVCIGLTLTDLVHHNQCDSRHCHLSEMSTFSLIIRIFQNSTSYHFLILRNNLFQTRHFMRWREDFSLKGRSCWHLLGRSGPALICKIINFIYWVFCKFLWWLSSSRLPGLAELCESNSYAVHSYQAKYGSEILSVSNVIDRQTSVLPTIWIFKSKIFLQKLKNISSENTPVIFPVNIPQCFFVINILRQVEDRGSQLHLSSSSSSSDNINSQH